MTAADHQRMREIARIAADVQLLSAQMGSLRQTILDARTELQRMSDILDHVTDKVGRFGAHLEEGR